MQYASFIIFMMITSIVSSTICPPSDFHSKMNFNPSSYFNGTWYSIVQLEVAYQPLSSFFCTLATYRIEKTRWCSLYGCKDTKVVVHNRGTTGLNGHENRAILQGYIPNKKIPSHVKVGPRFLPHFFYGDYWIIEAGTYEEVLNDTPFISDKYEWALISGGSPTLTVGNGCLAGIGKTNMKGFWFLSRDPEPSDDAIANITALAHNKGFDTTMWKRVVQKGCTYVSDKEKEF